jgi:hypothetical protein
VYFDGHLHDDQYLHIYMFNIFYLFVDRIMYLETESSVIFYKRLKICKLICMKTCCILAYIYIYTHTSTHTFSCTRKTTHYTLFLTNITVFQNNTC